MDAMCARGEPDKTRLADARSGGQKDPMKVTILMPCLNEAETLGACIRKADAWVKGAGLPCEILVADNGSTDGSIDIARSLGARVVPVTQKGYGAALYGGIQAARGEYVIMGDSDDSYDFGKLDAFVEKLDQGYDLVMGNRFSGGIAPGAMPWKNRYIGNPVLTFIGRLLFRCPVRDFHCGIRAFRKSAFERMDLRTSGMEFASEMVIKASLFGLKMTEVPVRLSKDGRSRPPHLRPWRDGWRHLKFMFLFSPRILFFYPGLLLFLLGLCGYAALLAGPLHLGSVVFDVHTLFYAQAIMELGFLSAMFGIAVRIFAGREGLMREHALLKRLRTTPLLEMGCLMGLVLIGAGLFIGATLLHSWGVEHFGPLEYGALLRSVSISTLLIIFGGNCFLFSLLMGFLTLPTRHKSATCDDRAAESKDDAI